MFSQELENLIQATLEDGVLEQYEKEALVKRAQAEGVDLTELEIYIQSILQRRQRELNEKKNAELSHKVQAAEEKKAEELKALGYKECPKCHKQVAPLTLVCECGFEFTRSKTGNSVKEFFEQITDIQLSEKELDAISEVVKDEFGQVQTDANGKPVKEPNQNRVESAKQEKRRQLIQTFPVPNTKEDIIEFLSMSASFAKKKGGRLGKISFRLLLVASIIAVFDIIAIIITYDSWYGLDYAIEKAGPFIFPVTFIGLVVGGLLTTVIDRATLEWNKEADLWRAKFDQVLMKGRSLRGDAEFTRQLDYYEEQFNK